MPGHGGRKWTEEELRDIYSRIPLQAGMSELEIDLLFEAEVRRRGTDTCKQPGRSPTHGCQPPTAPQSACCDSRPSQRQAPPGRNGGSSRPERQPHAEDSSDPAVQHQDGKRSDDPPEVTYLTDKFGHLDDPELTEAIRAEKQLIRAAGGFEAFIDPSAPRQAQPTPKPPGRSDDPYYRLEEEKDCSLEKIYLCNKFMHLQDPELTKAMREEIRKIDKAGGWLTYRMMLESTDPKFQERRQVAVDEVEAQPQDSSEVEEYLLNKFGDLLSNPKAYTAAAKLERQFIGAAGGFEKYMEGHEDVVTTKAPTRAVAQPGRVNPITAHLEAKFGHLKKSDEGAYRDACRGELERIKAAGGHEAYFARGGN